MSESSFESILVLGAGELGISVLQALATHPHLSNREITVLLRSTVPTTPSKTHQLSLISTLNIPIITADITSTPLPSLTALFKPYHTIISCTGFGAPPGTQDKLAHAVLDAGVQRYLPWQFGIDYDAIGKRSGQDLFDEQLDVRDLLRDRSQNTRTDWIIISTGMFMSFLFEQGFVVDLGMREKRTGKVVVTALGEWNNAVTVTDVKDIGSVVADIVLTEDGHEVANQVVYTAGERITYERLAQVLEQELGPQVQVEKQLLTVPRLENMLKENPDDGLVKYKLVFAKGVGISWDVDTSWNYRKRMEVTDVREWLREMVVKKRLRLGK